MTKLISYRFKIEAGETIDGPAFEVYGPRKLGGDAQAELHARRISEDNKGASVWIVRGTTTWAVRAPYVG